MESLDIFAEDSVSTLPRAGATWKELRASALVHQQPPSPLHTPVKTSNFSGRLEKLATAATQSLPPDSEGGFWAEIGFHGTVTEIDQYKETFSAQLWKIAGLSPSHLASEADEADATFPLAAVDEDDAELVHPGAVFMWFGGYRQGAGIAKHWESKIRFRRLPARTDSEIKVINSSAQDLLRFVQSRVVKDS